jgi:hypothetical protein
MRNFELTTRRLPKGTSYPLKRSSLEEVFAKARVGSVYLIHFHHWPGRPLFEAIFQGNDRSASWAGRCEVHINSVPNRVARQLEPLILSEVFPKFFEWLRIAERLAVEAPKDLSQWEARHVDGRFEYVARYARP